MKGNEQMMTENERVDTVAERIAKNAKLNRLTYNVDQVAEHIDEIAWKLSYNWCARRDGDELTVFCWYTDRQEDDEDTSEVIDTLPEGPAIRELAGKLTVAHHFTIEQHRRAIDELERVQDEEVRSLARGPDIAEMTAKYNADMAEQWRVNDWKGEPLRFDIAPAGDRQ
jgi:hypothetical protein